jgi:hypothetical protein
MRVGKLPLVAVVERERLEAIAFLSTARPLSVSSQVGISTAARGHEGKVLFLDNAVGVRSETRRAGSSDGDEAAAGSSADGS